MLSEEKNMTDQIRFDFKRLKLTLTLKSMQHRPKFPDFYYLVWVKVQKQWVF